ncbi:MAG: N(4)-(beta-N-acetylglucosaminyl)-L-asparaginase [Gemmatimonadota bacterium]|nr:MAG: N(4)-(beta-N-acetylglucosaminyl)-L-asparaginase [Gemmatimonadota bacterium]
MKNGLSRRDFMRTTASAVTVAAVSSEPAVGAAPTVLTSRTVDPVVISDVSGIRFRNGGQVSAVEKAFEMITSGADVLDALVAGVNIPELDPEEMGIGYGGLPNAEGVVQLDSCCMHGARKWAGGVAALEGVRTPSLVAKAVMEYTDHHLLVGQGAQDFARSMGFEIEADLNTEQSRALWLEWKRRVDPQHYLDPTKRSQAGYEAALGMVRDGLIEESHLWGTINCNGIGPTGDICGVTTTSGLAWKIPGRTGDSPILGAGLYVDGAVGAAGSTGRGEANLFNLSSYLIVESMRRGLAPKDAGMEALRRIRSNTVENRLLNSRGLPNFNVRFFALNASGDCAGVSMYAAGETTYAVCTENGAAEVALEPLLSGSPSD